MDGENLGTTITEILKTADFDIAFLRGQGCDSGANMSSGFNGAHICIFNVQPLAIYTQWAIYTHRLNKASTVPIIRNTVRIITGVKTFYENLLDEYNF